MFAIGTSSGAKVTKPESPLKQSQAIKPADGKPQKRQIILKMSPRITMADLREPWDEVRRCEQIAQFSPSGAPTSIYSLSLPVDRLGRFPVPWMRKLSSLVSA